MNIPIFGMFFEDYLSYASDINAGSRHQPAWRKADHQPATIGGIYIREIWQVSFRN